MAYCDTCKKRDTCKEMCWKLKKYFQSKKFKKTGYTLRHIRRMEIPFSNEYISKFYNKRNHLHT